MISILKVPGMMFQQRGAAPVQPEPQEEPTLNINDNNGEPAESHNPPPEPLAGGLQGSIGNVWQCTGFNVGNPPNEDVPDAGDYDYFPDTEDLPDTIEVDVDGDGEADLEVTDEADIPEDGVIIEDGDTPDVDEDGEADVEEDGDIIPDGEDGETAGPCDHAPFVDPIPAYPSIGALDVELTPTLNGADAVDIDPGDEIASYNFIVSANPDLSSPIINATDLPTSEYPVPAGILADATTYYWAMEAVDTCGRVTRSSATWSFTTLNTCAAYPLTDPTDLSLSEDPSAWSFRYEGTALPEMPLSLVGSFVAPTPESDGDNLSISTLGSELQGYYRMDTTRDNVVGSVTEIRVQVNGEDDNTPPLSTPGFMLTVMDGSRYLDIAIHADQVCESARAGICVPTPDPTAPHAIRLSIRGNDYQLYRDGTRIIDGTGLLASATATGNVVGFGDEAAGPDISAEVDYVRTYDLADRLPYVSPEFVSAPQDTRLAGLDHTGEAVNWSPASAAGTVTIAVRAADSLADLSTAVWSAELTDNPATVPAGVVGRYLQWRVTLTAPEPTTTPVVDEVTVTRTCP